jgi:hypothetical protein
MAQSGNTHDLDLCAPLQLMTWQCFDPFRIERCPPLMARLKAPIGAPD